MLQKYSLNFSQTVWSVLGSPIVCPGNRWVQGFSCEAQGKWSFSKASYKSHKRTIGKIAHFCCRSSEHNFGASIRVRSLQMLSKGTSCITLLLIIAVELWARILLKCSSGRSARCRPSNSELSSTKVKLMPSLHPA